ncbi:reverse transcriptase domain-containing protein [Tanacetum coccineum]
MPKYAKFLKGLLSNKTRLEEACTITMNERCSAVLLNKLPSKEKDHGSFIIPCDIGHLHINNALADLGSSISLMPYTMYEKLGLGEPKPTRMSLELADRSIQYPRGIAENVLIKIDKFIIPIDFVILDMRKDSKIQIILGRPFLATAWAMIDVFNKKITLRVGKEEVIFNVDQSMKRSPVEDDECYGINFLDTTIHSKIQELLEDDQLDSFLVSNLEESIGLSDLESCDKTEPIRRIEEVNTSYSHETKNEHLYSASANKIDEKRPVLKDLPSHLEYAYLKGDESCPVIISSKLTKKEKVSLLQVLEKHKGAIAWKMSDIKGIRFFQILIAPEDQEKMTFTCPYGTFAYRRMSFGLCNAPATFERCMTAIFHDMVEDFMEVFMDDFLVFGHKMFGKGIEVDKAKTDVIAKLPYPSNVKGVRSFLGHAGFYRSFIKYFSMISKPMTQLLMKDVNFNFSEDCKKAFNKLKEKMTTAFIIISLDWNEPFESMCDASDFAVGAFLGQRIDEKFKPIYYASKTLNDAQAHYTTTEKQLLAVIFSFDKFRPYLILSKTIVYIDHSALKYLFSKQDAKLRLIRWVLLLHGFNIKIKDKKEAENLAVDHLSRLENPYMGELAEDEIADKFPDEHLMISKAKLNDKEPWGNKYILVAVDYVFKWFEAQALLTNDARVVVKFLKVLFSRFGVPKALIRGTYFCNSQLEKALLKYGVTHKISMACQPQTNGQTKVTNRAIKRILERSVGYNPKDWSEKLNDALWAFRTAYKTPTRCTPFRMVYGKACHLPVEIEHKAYWALKQCNMDLTAAAKNRFMELNELMELRDGAYENTRIYKERTNIWHDSRLRGDKKFINGDKVLLFNSRLKLHPGKLKLKWSGPFVVKTMYPYGAVEITDKNGLSFKDNG